MSNPIEFPEKLQCLFGPQRYTVLHGGRGGAKSWGVARSYLIRGSQTKRRFLCTREIQKSIKDSVHKLLADQIAALGLGAFYEVQQTVIKGANGTEFLFSGLSDQTAESIKSFEGVDDVWVEEAQAVTKRSWDILIPTIRRDGSRITVTLNPELDTDETYVRFIENPPPDAVVVKVNYSDNPWFPSVLETERLHALATMPKADYDNIWEGLCKPAVTGAIYADEVARAQEQGRMALCPYDPALKVHVVVDIGWNDKMAIGLFQRHQSSLRCIKAFEDDHKTLDWYSAELRKLNLNWGKMFLPHDGEHANVQTGRSAKQVMEDLNWDVEIVANIPVEAGIRTARMGFAQTYFHKPECERLIQCLKRYKRNVPTSTGEPGAPCHDEWSHGADMFRYAQIAAPEMTNDADWGKALKYPNLKVV